MIKNVPTLSKDEMMMTRKVLGTQEPVLLLRTGTSAITTSIGGIVTTVIAADVSGIVGWASWAVLFDEYQILGCVAHVVSNYSSTQSTTRVNVVSVIDYDDANALSSAAQGLGYDTFKVYALDSFGGKENSSQLPSQHAHPQGQPDLIWVTTATPTTPFWFKWYNFGSAGGTSTTYANVFLEFKIRFRQVA